MAEHRNIEILSGFPADVLALSATGHVTRADYEQVVIPAVERQIKAEGRVKLFYRLGPEFQGLSAGAALEDAKLGLLHIGDLARVAVVTDVDWIRAGVRMFSPLISCPVHLFHVAETEAATVWISENVAPKAGGHEVDATHKLPLSEDRLPRNP